MTALPSATTATAGTATEGDVKNFITNLRDYLAGLFGTTGLAADAFAQLGLASQSVAYASNADTVDGLHKTSFTSWYWYWTSSLALGTTYTISLPNIGGNGLIDVIPYIECVTADGNYAVGDLVPFSEISESAGSKPSFTWVRNSHQAVFRTASSGTAFTISSGKGTAAPYTVTAISRWRFRIGIMSSIV